MADQRRPREQPEERRRSLQAAHVENTRSAILDSARAAFGTKGFAASSLDEIVDNAGVTKGALYHHFANKQALFREIFETIEHSLMERSLAAALATGPDPLRRLLAGFEAFLDASLEQDVRRIVLLDAPSVLGAEVFREIDERYGLAGVQAMVSQAVAEGVMRPLDELALSHLLLGAMTQAGTLIARADNPEDARHRVGDTLRALVEGLAIAHRSRPLPTGRNRS
jgi:AcrR family transcriptional regulator